MTDYTILGRALPQLEGRPSPTLVYLKWQAYDRFDREPERDRIGQQKQRHGQPQWKEAFGREESQHVFLALLENLFSKDDYETWHRSFHEAIEHLRGDPPRVFTTVWRLAIGWASNPTLETGLCLHHLYGFPYVPGSALKGLLHHVAEMPLWQEQGSASVPEIPSTLASAPPQGDPPPELLRSLEHARSVKEVFGSIVSEGLRPGNVPSAEPGARERLERWRAGIARWRREGKAGEEDREPLLLDVWRGVLQELEDLLGDSTVAAVTCFDAVPTVASARQGLFDVDVLTVHHPSYYREGGPPAEEDPLPLPFLCVRPGVGLEVRYRWRPGSGGEKLRELFESTLERALGEVGLGAKTAAGYGYFTEESGVSVEHAGEPPAPASRSPRRHGTDPLSPEEQAERYLHGRLDPSERAQRIDQAASLDPEVQRMVADLLRKRYPKEVARWREKAQTRPTIARRIAWLDRFPEDST